MATLLRRTSSNAQADVNLYCAQCDAQIGIFENEWIRLTSSYARSKERGTHFGTEVGQRTQVVPSGPTQRSAEGCVMAEVFCRKCSNMVGQYCKSAPDAEKQPLIDQYFYKLSRTYLKDSRTNARVEPIFGYGSDIVGPGGSRSSTVPGSGMTPTLRWANTPLRQSSRTPVMSAPGAGWRQSRQSSQISSLTTEIPDPPFNQSYSEMQKMQQELTAHRSTLDEQSSKTASQEIVLDGHDSLLRAQDARLTDQESCLDAQATRIVEQDALIQDQSRRLQAQQLQLTKITGQLIALQRSMADLKNLLPNLAQSSRTQLPENFGPGTSSDDFEAMVQKLRTAHRDAQELLILRDENTTMRSRLATFTNPESTGTDIALLQGIEPRDESLIDLQESQVLGKRKRKGRGRPPKSSVANRITSEESTSVALQNGAEQMPTPQSSQSCSGSPVQQPSVVKPSRMNTTQRKGTGPNARKSFETQPNEDSTKDLAPSAESQPHSQSTLDQASGITAQRPRSKSRRATLPASTHRKKDISSRVSAVMDARASDDDQSDGDAPNVPNRRLTRAATKTTNDEILGQDSVAGVAADVGINDSPLVPQGGSIELIHSTTPAPEPQLPTVQTASNILGMDLEALIASSEALRSGLSSLPNPVSLPAEHCPTPYAMQGRYLDGPAAQISSQNHSNFETLQQTEFIQDSAIYDNIDFSDDDDDLMQPNPTLYGEDSLIDGCNVALPLAGESARPQHFPSVNFERADRSMAPEPVKQQKKPTQPKKRPITLDRIHIATPQIFTEHILAGRAPKAIRPATTQARERELNAELTQLGLAEWIGKNKYSKAYREAVTAARARFRNSKKAAYLQSRGLNLNLSDPSASLPEQPAEIAGLISQKLPLSETENVPGPSADMHPTQPDLSRNSENHTTASKDEAPATRARVRRSSASLIHGLEDAPSQTAAPKSKTAPERRKSNGRRKNQQQPDTAVASLHPEIDMESSRHVNKNSTPPSNEQPSTAGFLTGLREAAMGESATVNGPKSLTPLTDGQADDSSYAKTQAQLREEAILLRDRMAKELMERDDMEI